ncbi:MAG: FAD-dependent oxidoreductase [Planctomycetota bacterium]|nr:FAD-dependent oxidoreductase [Planctomycetota bacterium]
MLNDPELLPPLSGGSLLSHLRRSPQYLGLLRWLGKPLKKVLEAYQLDKPGLFHSFLNATCQITVQCGVEEAEALFALSTLDYYFRGTQHIRGGLGELAKGLVQAIEKEQGDVLYTRRVKRLTRSKDRWLVETSKENFEVPVVVANVLPRALNQLIDGPVDDPERLKRWEKSVETGWGACMLYRVVKRPENAKPGACHIQLIQDPTKALQDGNHLFCSISGKGERDRAPEGYATMTVSTHVKHGDKRPEKIEEIQQRMRQGLKVLAPEWGESILYEVPGSPRTFERFTGRPDGFVGGVPRRAGLGNYKDLFPKSLSKGLYLVGDSVFPGQSTLATALGGHRVAHTILRSSGGPFPIDR